MSVSKHNAAKPDEHCYTRSILGDHFFVAPSKLIKTRSANVKMSAQKWFLLIAASALANITLATIFWTNAYSSSTPHHQGSGWKLVFEDTFEEKDLDKRRWTTCYWWALDGCTNLGNNELQWYQKQNISVENGNLILEGRKQAVRTNEGDYKFTSGMVTTGRIKSVKQSRTRFGFKYGYVEVRAKIPAGKGLWPAVWLLPTTLISTPEIDLMEVLGHKPDQLEMHYHYRENAEKISIGNDMIVGDLSQDWHLFAIDWRPDAIIWYLDDKEIWRFEDDKIISNEEMYLLINLAIGGDWPGPPNSETNFPARFLIDHVKIWQRDQ